MDFHAGARVTTRASFQSLFQYPIIQGPMAGGSCTPALVAAVSNAGALGALPASLLSPELMALQIGQIRKLTDRPFIVNLFVQQLVQLVVVQKQLDKLHKQLGVVLLILVVAPCVAWLTLVV